MKAAEDLVIAAIGAGSGGAPLAPGRQGGNGETMIPRLPEGVGGFCSPDMVANGMCLVRMLENTRCTSHRGIQSVESGTGAAERRYD